MPSTKDYLDFILDQLSELKDISYRKMMGEFIIYYKDKIVGGIYDNRFLVKPSKSAMNHITKVSYESPYPGVKEMLLVEDIDNKQLLTELLNATYDELYGQKSNKSSKPFDYKKEFKELYMPKTKPGIVTVPQANYIAIRGKGDPNEEGGAYQQAISILYALSYTLKMSYKTNHEIKGFFDYVVPPLEGFWWQDDIQDVDYTNKASFNWISVIRLPDFVTKEDFDWAVETATKKKKIDCSNAEFLTMEEGLCVQIMHLGPFDDEPATVAIMDDYLAKNGYENDFNNDRLHHEIYLTDARRTIPEKMENYHKTPYQANQIEDENNQNPTKRKKCSATKGSTKLLSKQIETGIQA